MSTKVVTARASHAKRPVRSDKPAKQAEQQPAVNEDEARLAKDDSEQEVSVASVNEDKAASVEAEPSMAGEFTFGTALAEAAAASGSLISDAQRADEVGFGAFGDGDGSTPLLLAAIGLAAVGLIFIVKDGGGGDDVVAPINKAPTITAPAAATTAEDTVLQIAKPVTADADVGDTVTVTASATNGAIVKNADGSFTYTPAANFNGTATITYSATDGKVTTPVTATQTVTVTAVNDSPTITAGAVAAIAEDSTAGATFTVTTADVDAGSAITTSATVPSAQGTVTKNADGSFKFVPAANFNGTATVVVTASDGTASTSTNVPITVTPVNDPAVATPLTATTAEDTALNLSDVITVTDVDGNANAVTASITTQPQHGTITIVAGDVIYTPAANFNGSDSLVLTLKDDANLEANYTVTLNVTPVNDAPVLSIVTATVTTPFNTTFTNTISATDVEGDTLTYSISTAAGKGTASIAANGAVTYVPNTGTFGADTFTVRVSDGNNGADTAIYNITVAGPPNQAPVFNATAVSITVPGNQAFSATLASTAIDPDNDPLTFGLESQASNGVAVVSANGSYTYTPNSGFSGTDSYQAKVEDGQGGKDTLLINVTVTAGQSTTSLALDNSAPSLLAFLGINSPAADGAIVTLNANDAYALSENATSRTSLVLRNFNENDVISVQNASQTLYAFGTAGANGEDLRITLNSGGNFTDLIIDDALVGFNGFIFDYGDAVDALGFNFMTFA